MSAFFVKICDRPLESVYFAHSDVSTPKDSTLPNKGIEVEVTGDHELSGRHGFICGVGDRIRGIGRYQVELEPEKSRVYIATTNLLPRCVYVHNYLDGSVAKASITVSYLKLDLIS